VILINQYNPTTRIAREAKQALETHYPEFLSPTVIRQCTQFAQASGEGLPISAYAPKCKGSHDMDELVALMMNVPMETAKEKSAREAPSKRVCRPGSQRRRSGGY